MNWEANIWFHQSLFNWIFIAVKVWCLKIIGYQLAYTEWEKRPRLWIFNKQKRGQSWPTKFYTCLFRGQMTWKAIQVTWYELVNTNTNTNNMKSDTSYMIWIGQATSSCWSKCAARASLSKFTRLLCKTFESQKPQPAPNHGWVLWRKTLWVW